MIDDILRWAAPGLVTAGVVGCSDLREEPRGDLFIASVVKLTGNECLARADPEATMLGFGILDTSFAGDYLAPLLVGNSIPDDVRGVTLSRAMVRLSGVDASVIAEFTSESSGFVPAPAGGQPGWGIMFVELLPGGLVQASKDGVQRVNAKVRVFGEVTGGIEIESSELTFPISVCDGCLVDFPPDAIDPAGKCASGMAPASRPCNFGQDAPVDCRLCQGIPACDPSPSR